MTTFGHPSSLDPRLSPVRTYTYWPLSTINSVAPSLRAHLAAIATSWAPGTDLVIENQAFGGFRKDCFNVTIACPLHIDYDNHMYIPIDSNPGNGYVLEITGWSSGSNNALAGPVEREVQFLPGVEDVSVTTGSGDGVIGFNDHTEMIAMLTDPTNNSSQHGIVVAQMDNGDIVAQATRQLVGPQPLRTVYMKWLNRIPVEPVDSLGVYWMAMKWKKTSDLSDGTFIFDGRVVPRSAVTGRYAASPQVGILGWYADSDDVEIRDTWAGSYVYNSKQYGWAGHVAGGRNISNPGAFMACPTHQALTIANATGGARSLEGRFTNMDNSPRLFQIQLAGSPNHIVAYNDTVVSSDIMSINFVRSPTAGEQLVVQNLGRMDTGSEDAGGEMDGLLVSTMLLQGGVVNTCGDVIWEAR